MEIFIRKSGLMILACLALVVFSMSSCATQKPRPTVVAKPAAKVQARPKVTWVHPVIAKYGGVHPRPDVDMQLDPKANYKVFVDLTSGPMSDDPTHMIGGLGRLARLVNLMGYSKVPPEHVHIVALLDEHAAFAALKDDVYAKAAHFWFPKKAKKGMKNPNLPLIHALKKAGVKLMICSQLMAAAGFKDSAIDPSVTITLSGLSDPVIYGNRGYTYMRL